MKAMRTFSSGAIVASVVLAAWIGQGLFGKPIAAQTPQRAAGGGVPVFEAAAWPKPLPNNWVLGPVSGITVDAVDHVWIVHRPREVKQPAGVPAPPVIEFDAEGNVVQAWGGPGTGYEWPEQEHGISVDHRDNVWVSASGDHDAQILKFSRGGKFLLQIGHQGKNGGSNDTANLGMPTQMRVDRETHEVYVSDGEQNHRVIVFDADTGAYKRHWGAYGEKPDDKAATKYDPNGPPSTQFGSAVHCIHIAADGLLYVCDRANSRIQVFRKDGTFVKEARIAAGTSGAGSVWDLEFSPDQKFVYVADGSDQKVWILRRDQLQVVGSFGEKGSNIGQFATSVHDIAIDSKGNLYTGEAANGSRVQKFASKGLSY